MPLLLSTKKNFENYQNQNEFTILSFQDEIKIGLKMFIWLFELAASK